MVSRYVEVGRVGKANQYIVNRLSLELWCRNLVGVSYTKRRFKRRWRSAPVGQEFQPKTWLFEARDDMPEKMKRQ